MYSKARTQFFRSADPAGSYATGVKECSIQVPTVKDLRQMRGMTAGAYEDQCKRLSHMAREIAQIKAQNEDLPVMDTDCASFPPVWKNLFLAIHRGDERSALDFLSQIPVTDQLLQALVAVHPLKYLKKIICDCVQANFEMEKTLNLGSDVVITPGTFEILVKDIAATLFHSGKAHFSFGLPTHHAFSTQGSGFCVMNKTEILLKYLERVGELPTKYIIVGTDVNRDNGLNYNLLHSAENLDICHIDIFDSRVYPWQNQQSIGQQFSGAGEDASQNIKCWQQGNLSYFAVDLSLTVRKDEIPHPALAFALQQIEAEIKKAHENSQKIALFLPTGWDSHEKETARCGIYINNKKMDEEEAHKTRFSDQDLSLFYERIFELYYGNIELIEKMYWGLEGGYEPSMYKQEIKSLMDLVLEKLVFHHFKDSDLGCY